MLVQVLEDVSKAEFGLLMPLLKGLTIYQQPVRATVRASCYACCLPYFLPAIPAMPAMPADCLCPSLQEIAEFLYRLSEAEQVKVGWHTCMHARV